MPDGVICAYDLKVGAFEMNNDFNIDTDQMQKVSFIEWYALNIGTKKSAKTISTAINKCRFKNGKNIFSIIEIDELESALGDLKEWLFEKDGTYSRMNEILDFDEKPQMDDLKSGIKYYFNFLSKIDYIKNINLYININKIESDIIKIDYYDNSKQELLQEKINTWDYSCPRSFIDIYNICDKFGNHNYNNDDDQKISFLQLLRQIKYAAMLCGDKIKNKIIEEKQ